jgi:putative ABC transport system ATP-binding protein
MLPDVDVVRGRSLAILGASGSGKTTALLALAGIRAPARGEVVIEDRSVWRLTSAMRDKFRGLRIGLVFQSFHLVDAVSVATNLTLAATCAGLRPDAQRVRHLLDRLGISELRNRRADRISQGQAQRVAVARALFNRPAVVLADEPTSALDDASAARLLALLKDAAATEGAGLIIATHDRRVIDAVDGTIELRVLS